MPNKETILEILKDACRAPSADNTQPWRFIVSRNRIKVINVGDQVESLFNYRQMVNHASLGACVENIRISAGAHGLRADIQTFPNATDTTVVAEAVLTPDPAAQNQLARYIHARASNRKRYHSTPIEETKLRELQELETADLARIVLVADTTAVTKIADIVSAGERIALENRPVHDFLFNHVTWTKKEDEQKHGFFIDTFEFAPPQKALFKLLSNWNILKFFIPLGFPNFVAKDMARVYGTSGAFGAIVMPDNSPESYLQAGMLFERIWLTATKLGLALQPATGLHFFAQPVLAGDTFDLPKDTVSFIAERYVALKEVFGVSETQTVAIAFRLGYADAPSARTTRFDPQIVFED